jgi:hypothetical protein
MAWPEIRLQSWGEFVARAVNLETPPIPQKFFFRGQANASWSLRPSLARGKPTGSMTAEEVDKIHAVALAEFIEHMKSARPGDGHYLPSLPDNQKDWVALMQHYRVTTRLLDWSFSPYIAAYFAVAELAHWEADGTIWFFNELYLEPAVNARMHVQAALGKAKMLDADLAMYGSFVSDYPNPRIKAQNGLFTWHRNIDINHDDFIDDILGNTMTKAPNKDGKLTDVPLKDVQEHYGKMIIPADLKPIMLNELRGRKNITAKTVYTGLEGLGQFIAESIQLRLSKALG